MRKLLIFINLLFGGATLLAFAASLLLSAIYTILNGSGALDQIKEEVKAAKKKVVGNVKSKRV